MPDQLRVICYGLGPIGCEIVRALVRRPGFEVVGGVDIDPNKVGRDLGELAGLGRPLGVTVSGELDGPLRERAAELVLHATATCQEVTAVRASRVLDAGRRRLPLQTKVGAGLTVEEFQRLVDSGAVRHVGLAESVRMVADSLGWVLDRV